MFAAQGSCSNSPLFYRPLSESSSAVGMTLQPRSSPAAAVVCAQAEAAAFAVESVGPAVLGDPAPRLVPVGRGAGSRETGNRSRLAPRGISALLDVASPAGAGWLSFRITSRRSLPSHSSTCQRWPSSRSTTSSSSRTGGVGFYPTPDCGVGRPTTAGNASRGGSKSLCHPGPLCRQFTATQCHAAPRIRF